MSILFNAITLFCCLCWLYKSNKSSGVLVGIVFAFLGGTFVSLILSFFVQHDYLDILGHLLVSFGSISLFWILSIVILFIQKKPLSSNVIPKILILSIPLLAILLIYLWISTASFKIGG